MNGMIYNKQVIKYSITVLNCMKFKMLDTHAKKIIVIL